MANDLKNNARLSLEQVKKFYDELPEEEKTLLLTTNFADPSIDSIDALKENIA